MSDTGLGGPLPPVLAQPDGFQVCNLTRLEVHLSFPRRVKEKGELVLMQVACSRIV